ncbi:MAG: hypothetical protein PHQ23_09235 [Candidatus Wallbacteria bacterium]|nr:hypothetical protein [Candidatus Wallbacteria bacterium]
MNINWNSGIGEQCQSLISNRSSGFPGSSLLSGVDKLVSEALGGKLPADKIEISLGARSFSAAIGLQKGSEEAVYAAIEQKYLKVQISVSGTAPEKTASEENKKAAMSDEAEELDSMLGEWSTRKVSDRIAEFAKAVYESLLAGDGGAENQDQLEKFKKIIFDAISLGFQQGKQDAGEVSSPVAELQQRTYDLIQEKLTSYFDKRLSGLTDGQETGSTSYSMEIQFEYQSVTVESVSGKDASGNIVLPE